MSEVTKPVARSHKAWTCLDHAKQREFPQNNPDIIEIWGYTDRISYCAGETIRLHIHTTAPTFDIEVYRDGPEKIFVHEQKGLAGVRQHTPEKAYEVGCNWSEVACFEAANDWKSGTYLVIFRTLDEHGSILEREAFFVLRQTPAGRKSTIAFVLATGTYMAYSDWGGANAYRSYKNGMMTDDFAPILSMNRPWARGFARLPIGAPRYSDFIAQAPGGVPRYPWLEFAFNYQYSRHYPDAGWACYDRPFSHWLESEGYAVDYFSQHDLHANPDALQGYNVVVIGGHDEYWTWEMRDAMDNFVESGGNLARFGGNFFWQVRMEDNNRTQICHKVPEWDPLYGTDQERYVSSVWEANPIRRPGAETVGLCGLSGTYARMPGAAPRSSGAMTVYRPDHWVYDNTDLFFADSFGGAPSYIVSFEMDGANFEIRNGLPYPTGRDGVPKHLEILAMATTAGLYETSHTEHPIISSRAGAVLLQEHLDWNIGLTQEEILDTGNVVMGVCSKGKGQIFTVGCSEWVAGLIKKDVMVEQITRNVINKFR